MHVAENGTRSAFMTPSAVVPHTRFAVGAICPRRLPCSMPQIQMADISKPRPGIGGPKGPQFGESDRGGGVAVITKPVTKKKTKRKSQTELEPSWRVLLHNDDVHTFDYVTGAIVKVSYREFLCSAHLFLGIRHFYTYKKRCIMCADLYISIPFSRWYVLCQERRHIELQCKHMRPV